MILAREETGLMATLQTLSSAFGVIMNWDKSASYWWTPNGAICPI
jgi:hypothetical protein